MVLMLVLLTGAAIWLLRALAGGKPISLVIGVAVIVGFALLARRALRAVRSTAGPVGELIEASARVEAGQFGTQVAERGPREVRTLARAFNSMSARLAETEAGRRRLLADIGHELRTPLTVVQGNVEGILDGLYPADRSHLERILVETQHMERLIEDLRTLSLAEVGALRLSIQSVDLAALAAEVLAGFEPQAAAAGVTLSLDAGGAQREIQLDPLRVRQVISNLVANALRHTPRGGRVTVAVAQEGETQVLTVADTGSGMDAEALAHAFDRFWRAADSAGAGLGLSIVRDLVTAHGGTVEIHSAPGGGTTVSCRF